MKIFFILFFLISPLASQELVDVLWNKKNLSEPYSYNQLADYIEKSSKFDTNLKGKISIGKVLGKGFTTIVDQYNIYNAYHQEIPDFSIEISFENGNVIPDNTGLMLTTHPFWNIQFGIGKSFNDSSLDVAVILIPFSLMHKDANCVHTGVSIFSIDKSFNASNIIFQIASETCAYFKFDYISIYEAKFTDLKTNTNYKKNISVDYDEIDSFDQLYAKYQIKSNSFGDSKDFLTENMTIYGLIDGDKYLALSPCFTRLGNNIFCNQIVLPSYSLAKSIAGSLSLSLVNNKYKDISQYFIRDLIPQCDIKKWSNVTLENLSDMSTGQYFSTKFDYDESSITTTNFLFKSNTHDKKVKLACKAFPKKRTPGKAFVYHTSDTYLLGTAMNNYLKNNSNVRDYFDDVLVPFLDEKNFSEISKHSLRTDDASRTPFTGWGMYFSETDMKKLSKLFHSIKKNKNSPYKFIYEALNPDYANTLIAIRSDDIYYNNGFWSKVFDKDIFGCQKDIWVPFMSGFGGITFAFFPNGMSYFYFSDGYTYSWNDAAMASHEIRSFCEI